jgi:hypothetical protein
MWGPGIEGTSHRCMSALWDPVQRGGAPLSGGPNLGTHLKENVGRLKDKRRG